MANPNWMDSDDDWTTPGDWSTGTVPGAGDNVTVAEGDPQITSDVGTVASVTDSSGITIFDGALATTGAITIDTDHSLGVDNLLTGGGSTLKVGGTLALSGSLFIGNSSLGAATTVTATQLTISEPAGASQAPAITIVGNATEQAELDVTGASAGLGAQGAVTSVGAVSLTNDAVIQFASGQINTIAANSLLALNGAGAQVNDAGGTTPNSALNGLSNVAGNLTLDNGAAVTTGALTNSGFIGVDAEHNGAGSSVLAVEGTLTNAKDANIDIGIAGGSLATPTTVTVAALANSGGIILSGSTSNSADIASLIVNGATTGSGVIDMETGGKVELNGAASNTVQFFGTNDVLELDTAGTAFASKAATVSATADTPSAAGGAFTGKITGFAAGDTLDLANEVVTIKSYNGTTLTVQTTGGTTQSYELAGPKANSLEAVSDGQSGTDIVVMCFVTGTLIRTARGEVAVEDLRIGDLAVTASDRLRPITWIGHRHIDGHGRTLLHDRQPIRIRKGAFGPGLPARDLRLSPGHPVLVGGDENTEGGVLVPITCLINGTSIRREPATSVTYWHIELDTHDILLAEAFPAESYLDCGDRGFFSDGADHALANPDFVVPGLGSRCRPVAVDGRMVEAERRRLDAVFATQLAGACAWPDAMPLSVG